MHWYGGVWNNACPMNIGYEAELSDVRSNATGHCYLEFVQKDPRSNNLIAKARGTIWNNVYRPLKPYFEEATGQLFISGIKVLVKVTVQFHELYGYSLTVQILTPHIHWEIWLCAGGRFYSNWKRKGY